MCKLASWTSDTVVRPGDRVNVENEGSGTVVSVDGQNVDVTIDADGETVVAWLPMVTLLT